LTVPLRKLASVSKILFDTQEAAQTVDSRHQPRTAQLGATVGENWSVTGHYPVESGWPIALYQGGRLHDESYRIRQTVYQPVIDCFSPISQKSELRLALHDPANRTANAADNDFTLLLLLNVNKFLFCSYQRTAPGSPPTRTTA
jgi:hypothetical protein